VTSDAVPEHVSGSAAVLREGVDGAEGVEGVDG
jgi:hypothetical protein